ncbi:MAG: PAS domain S-box protein [Elusimicrobia bacterium]|nr:PAS domain S-box protein [Elusimicrobiota bacterium]
MSGALDEKLFAWAFEQSDAALVGIDESRAVRTWTRGASALLGFPREEALGRAFSEFFAHPKDCGRLLEAASGAPVLRNVETVLMAKGGAQMRAYLTLRAFPGKVFLAEFSPIVVDFEVAPEHKAVREALVRMERFCSVGRMTAAFTHQMRTPLHVVSSTAEFALEFLSPSGKLRECLEMILRNAHHATESVKSLLDFAKAGRPRLVEASLNDAVRAAAQLIEKLCASRRVELKLELGEPAPALFDPPQIRAVVQNVLVNAADASAQGGLIEARTSSSAEGGAQLVVRDTGPGMTPEVLARASTPFFTTKEDGTGLGLYLSKRVLAEHGASFHIDSLPGRGTTVTIRFPPSARSA